MRKVYITGLVRVADTVRRSLAAPLSPERRADIRRLVANSVAQVDSVLVSKGATAAQLPPPSRRAYEFLKTVDLDNGAAPAAGAETARPAGTVTMRGLTAFWEGLLERLAQPLDACNADKLRNAIATTSADIQRYLARHQLRNVDLKRPSREAYAWLRFFATDANFDDYLAAVRTAHPLLRAAISSRPRYHANVWLEFRPMSGLYRVRGSTDTTRVVLPTPMIRFDVATFQALAAAMFQSGSKQAILEAARSEPYQTTQAELDALTGLDEHTAGMHHDLAESFDRVARQYFNGDLNRPRLTWNRTFTGRKFGHYDPLTDTVMVSCTLDHADVPRYLVDFVMYHELLHKELGVDWRNGRQQAHTPEFRRRERLFVEFAAADKALNAVARRHACADQEGGASAPGERNAHCV